MAINVQTAEKDKYLDYLKTKGKAGARTLEILGKNYEFLKVFNTTIGYEVLKDVCQMHEESLNKIAELKSTDEDKITYRVLQKLINRWSKRLFDYENELGKVMK
jgi:hypothetical protein